MNLETLAKFANSSGWRPKFKEPFVFDGKTYATDGHVLVRLDTLLEGAAEYPDFPYEQIQGNFESPLHEPVLLKDYWTEVQTEECSVCKGTGRIRTCPECEGDGYISLDSGWNTYEVECQTCYGTGKLSGKDEGEECDNCDGTGSVSFKTRVRIGEVEFDNRLLNKLIENLPPDATISTSRFPNQGAVINFPGGQGLLMPLRQ